MGAWVRISSVKNPAVAAARSLESAKERKKQGLFLLDGEHMVGEALNTCPERVQAVFLEEDRPGLEEMLEKVPETAARYLVPGYVLESLSQVKTSQGIAALCAIPPALPLTGLGDKLVLLENVQDPGNVGTVIRTADAAGFSGCLLTPGCADPYGGKVLRATMGSLFRVPLVMVSSAREAAEVLRTAGYAVIGAELHGEPFYLRGKTPDKLCVMIGNEGAGLTREALESCTHRYLLPMRGGAESLNAAVAAAIFMYDLMNR